MAQDAMAKDDIRKLKEFEIKPIPFRVEKLDTPLRDRGDAPKAAIKPRQSLQYYWSGQRDREKQRQICLLKAETDPKTGKLWRTAILHSTWRQQSSIAQTESHPRM